MDGVQTRDAGRVGGGANRQAREGGRSRWRGCSSSRLSQTLGKDGPVRPETSEPSARGQN